LASICSFFEKFQEKLVKCLIRHDYSKIRLGITESRISSFTKCIFTHFVFRPIHEECIKHLPYPICNHNNPI
ncbi:MAG TPA: hypothetical protein VIA09_00090, partial [Nitrososphaeraceae archaeon]